MGDDLFVGGGSTAPGGTATLQIGNLGFVDVIDQVIIWDGGTVVMGGNSVLQGATLQIEGRLEGSGDLEFATISNAGTIDPGAPSPEPAVGVFNIAGDLVQSADGVLRLDVYGQFSTQIDRLTVGGDLDLDGTLYVTNPTGYPLIAGTTYPIMQCAGTPLDGEVFVEGETVYLRLVVPCPEDLDGSGAVDIADLLAVLGAWGMCG